MEIQKIPAIVKLSSDFQNLPKDLSRLPVGATLNGVVTGKLDDSNYLLKLSGNIEVRAQSIHALELGQAMRLEVVKTGAVPELKLVLPEQQTPPEQVALQQALRQLLPKQQSLSELVNVLRQLSNLPVNKTDQISAAAQALLSIIPSKEALMSASQLEQAINHSGVFLEAKLANQLSPEGDLKGTLLTLADSIQKADASHRLPAVNDALAKALPMLSNLSAISPNPIDNRQLLLKTAESAIARIVLDQLAALPQNNETQNVWQIEIPYLNQNHNDAVKLTIKRESHMYTETGQANWSVLLEIKPPELGVMHCKISMVDGKVDTCFWSNNSNTLTEVEQNLKMLSARYQEAGLTTGHLNVIEGVPAKPIPSKSSYQPPLLDEYL